MALPVYDKVTIEEYLRIELEDEQRYEYHEGYLLRMSGGSVRHEKILDNVYGEIRASLKAKKSKCQTFGSGLKIEVTPGIRFVYADSSVFCEELKTSTSLPEAARNPIVVIEVLSKSTAPYDHSLKLSRYRAIPSMRACLLIYQSRPCVYRYQRKDKLSLYSFNELTGIDAELTVDCLGVTVPFSELYDGVTFDPLVSSRASLSQKMYEPVSNYGN